MPANCPPGKIINPATNRCVSKNGTIGRKLLKQTQTQTKQPPVGTWDLPPDVLTEIMEFSRIHNCGTFILDTLVKYPNLDAADAQTKKQLRTVVFRTLMEFRRRLLTSHYIKRSFMKEADIRIPLGKRVDSFITRANSTNSMAVLIDMCKQVVLMKREACVIVQRIQQFIQHVQHYVKTGVKPNDFGKVVVEGSIGLLEDTWQFASRETLKFWARAYKRNLVKDEEALTNILQPVRVQV
jgi:hypothetical protein